MIATRLAVPLAALGVATFAVLPREHPGELRLSAARGGLELVNSRAGQAAFAAGNMKPGDTTAGTLTVTNRGSSEARLFLRSSQPMGRGALGDVLRVRVAEGRATVASGTLDEVAGCHDLGMLAAGSTRSFRFSASWPPGDRDNAYAGSTVRADEHWFANADGGGCVAGQPKVADTIERSRAARLAISHRRVRLVRGRAKLRVRCLGEPGATCAGTIRLRARNRLVSRVTTAAGRARTSFEMPAGRVRSVYLPVPVASRATLRRRRKAVALAVIEPARTPPARVTRLVTLIR
jgi:hypothetical protein